jgi:hypothetical protein
MYGEIKTNKKTCTISAGLSDKIFFLKNKLNE